MLLRPTTSLLLVLVAVWGVCGEPCPPGTLLYTPWGLCYWEITTLLSPADAQAQCAAMHQDGGLALIPDPQGEEFILANFDVGIYYPGPLDCGGGMCSTRHVGYRHWGGRAVYEGQQGAVTPWLPFLSGTFPEGSYFRVYNPGLIPPRLVWMAGASTSLRKSLCSTWADLSRTGWVWYGKPGRLTGCTQMEVSSLAQCAVSCHLRNGCATFNFQRSSRTCERCPWIPEHLFSNLTLDPDFKRYDLRA